MTDRCSDGAEVEYEVFDPELSIARLGCPSGFTHNVIVIPVTTSSICFFAQRFCMTTARRVVKASLCYISYHSSTY